MWTFDATLLYFLAVLDEKALHRKIDTGYAFTEDVDDVSVQKMNIQAFIQERTSLEIFCYNPANEIVQHMPEKIEPSWRDACSEGKKMSYTA